MYNNNDNGSTGMDSESRVQSLVSLADKAFAKSERVNAVKTWKELAEYILPSQFIDFNSSGSPDGSRGSERTSARLFDSTAITANRDLSSALHSTITNPLMKWSKLRFKDEKLNEMQEAVAWLDEISDIIHDYLNESNFDTQVSKAYQSLPAFGSMILYHGAIEKHGAFQKFQFEAWHLGHVAYCENSEGYVDTIYRKFPLTLKKCYELWGDKIGQDLVEKYNKDPYAEIQVLHAVYPRDPKEVELNKVGVAPPNKRPFASEYVLIDKKRQVEEGGFYEFPVYVPRWSALPGEEYGNGPGHVSLPDIRTVNRVKKEVLKALAKAVNPPMLTEQRNVINGDLGPGKLVTVKNLNKTKEIQTTTRFDVAHIELTDLRNTIKSIFFLDKLMLPPRTETGEMTAYEISQRLEQMQQILGPTLSRLNSEFLTPFILRCMKILLRANKLPPMPIQLQQLGKTEYDLQIVFVNALARSQQIAELRNIQTWIQETAGIAQLKPEVLDNLNVDEILYEISRIRGISEKFILSEKEVKAIRDQRSQQQQAQAALEALKNVPAAAK